MEIKVIYSKESNRSVALDGEKEIGVCAVSLKDGAWVIETTKVDEAYGGMGIAKRLVLAVVEAARAEGVKIIPICSYAKHVLDGKEEFLDVLA